MATKKASTTKATDETAVKKTVTRRKRTVKKAVEEPVVMESVVEVTSEVPTVEETTQDSSVQQQGPVIARPTYFTGSIDELNAAIQQAAQQNQSGFDNGLQNPALGIQQQPVQTTIQFPVTPVMETKVVNPAAMGSEQKAALEQQIQQTQPITTKKEEVNTMTKQENMDKVNEAKMDQQVKNEEAVISAALANKIADKIAEENKKDDNKLFDAVIEGMLVGTAAGVGVVAGSYAADKAITAFEEWRNNKDKAEEATKLVSGLL
nr:MAG TPA: hypothetical protein [Caudoviricetes sp.]